MTPAEQETIEVFCRELALAPTPDHGQEYRNPARYAAQAS